MGALLELQGVTAGYGSEAIAALANAFKHPALRFFKCAPPQRLNPKRPQEFENVI